MSASDHGADHHHHHAKPTNAAVEKLSRTPRRVSWAARSIMVIFPIVIIAICLLPWTQYAHGTGRAIAFNPVQRPQVVMATIEGRIYKWNVVEGQKVKMGDKLVELIDNDPELLRRMEEEETMIEGQGLAVQGMIASFESQVTNQRVAQIQQLAVERQQVLIAQNDVDNQIASEVSARATLTRRELDYPRTLELFNKGLDSQRSLETAKQELDNAKAAWDQSKIRVVNSRDVLKRAQESRDGIKALTDAQINTLEAQVKRTRGELLSVDRLRINIQSRIERQRRQTVDAPVTGTVFRLLANGESGGQLVRAGDRLAILVPDITDAKPIETDQIPAFTALGGGMVAGGMDMLTPGNYPGIVAEVLIDGNDLPLVQVGDKARLQFEGWPAVQFVGWPSAAVGTFGGRVYLVDPTAEDKNGQFRILIEPDPEEVAKGKSWPNEQFLRQGVRVQGWVLFNDVPVWWELFRQINGFPPTRDIKPKIGGGSFGPVERKVKK
ncbi:MAG: HlyD family secretion protein [Gemmataceae bacterium]